MTLTEKLKALDQLRHQHQLACDYQAVSPEWDTMRELVDEIEASINRLVDEIQREYLKQELNDLQDQTKNICSAS